jgi:hypothetical protein
MYNYLIFDDIQIMQLINGRQTLATLLGFAY